MKKIILMLLSLSCIDLSEAQEKQNISNVKIEFKNLFDASANPDVNCYRIPALTTAPNGDLLVVIDERKESCADLNKNKDINIVARRSCDNGVNWSEIITVIDYPYGKSASDPSLIVDKQTKMIFLFYNFMDHISEPGIYYQHVAKSTDNGRSWSEPEDITNQITKPEWNKDFKFITSGKGIQTSSGILLHTLVNLQHGLHVFGSSDHGKTWFVLDAAISPADESKIVELSDGSWMINSRVNKSGKRFVHKSTDRGKTWQTKEDKFLVDPGCNASILRYERVTEKEKKNILLFSNANSSSERMNMSVRISYDDGKTWTSGKSMYKGSSAYSSLTVLANGDIGLLFEKDNYTENVFVGFTIDWLEQNQTFQPNSNDSIIYLNIPERSDDALDGSKLVDIISGLEIKERETVILQEILSGNVPSFSRKLKSSKINQIIDEKKFELIFFAATDYMAVGSDLDYLYIPVTPLLAQKLADDLNCSLPTKKIVDIIYSKADIKLTPQPIPPSDKMTTVHVFRQHTDSIKQQMNERGIDRFKTGIFAGHKKDVIISNKIYSKDRTFDRVVIYGWHKSENDPIQPVYNGHTSEYADYSHGIRLIADGIFINKKSYNIKEVFKDPGLSFLLCDEGMIYCPYYPEYQEINK